MDDTYNLQMNDRLCNRKKDRIELTKQTATHTQITNYTVSLSKKIQPHECANK